MHSKDAIRKTGPFSTSHGLWEHLLCRHVDGMGNDVASLEQP